MKWISVKEKEPPGNKAVMGWSKEDGHVIGVDFPESWGITYWTPLPAPPSKREKFLTLPDSLASPEFQEVWSRWERHRREIGHRLTPTTIASQLKKLESWGSERATAALENSIENGYQGIFEPNGRQNAADSWAK